MVAGLAVAGVPLWGEQLTAGQVPLSLSVWMIAMAVELCSIGLNLSAFGSHAVSDVSLVSDAIRSIRGDTLRAMKWILF